jgi:FkbH-like protein
MRLSEALHINQQPASPTGDKRKIHLVCGFTPLHLETVLKAQAKLRFAGDEIEIIHGLFGDFENNLHRAAKQAAEGAVVALEWSDLDQRLGMRASAGWGKEVLADVLQQVPEKLRRLTAGLAEAAKQMPVAVIMPTLPLPPLTHFPLSQANPVELHLRCAAASSLNNISGLRGVRLVSESELDLRSPHAARYDAKLDLHAGFPYTVPHAVAVAGLALECLFPAAPKKGLITDLDDTLWKGIVGDAGAEGVSWSLERHSQGHALYQQLLASLAEAGVLVAVASRNDAAAVRKVLERPDILLKESQMFPLQVNWGAKSESVGRILRAWNVAADSVVLVDDSPMELAEVAEKYPAMECLRFPAHDSGILELLRQLRSRFGKAEVREEDHLRLQSLRSASAVQEEQSAEGVSPDFLSRLQATLTFSTCPGDGRAFELVNKTNQFNLNGRRYTENEWRTYFQQPGAFLVAATYEDRFGPLGKIAVLGGRELREKIRVDMWVMSCRAFSRQIEFQMLRRIFQTYRAPEIELFFRATPHNGPLQDFLRHFFPGGLHKGSLELSAALFERAYPPLFHQVIETNHG